MLTKTELIAFRTEPRLAERLRQAAAKHDRPQSWLIRKALESFLREENENTAHKPNAMHSTA